MNKNIEKLANAWIDLHVDLHKNQNEMPEFNPNFWAFEELDGMDDGYTRNDPKKAWTTILKILSIDSSDVILSNVAAGSLEDLLAFHGEDWISSVENEASKNTVFKTALLGIYQNEMSDDVWDRLQIAAGRR